MYGIIFVADFSVMRNFHVDLNSKYCDFSMDRID